MVYVPVYNQEAGPSLPQDARLLLSRTPLLPSGLRPRDAEPAVSRLRQVKQGRSHLHVGQSGSAAHHRCLAPSDRRLRFRVIRQLAV
eukprot:g60544.t1